MKMHHRAAAILAAAGMAFVPTLVAAPAANAGWGSQPLASVLLADTVGGNPSFDRKGTDFDILTAAVLLVLDEKPTSAVSVLTDGSVKLTAFLPTDNAFRRTGAALGITASSEAKLAGAYVKALGVDTIEKVLLYHVVPGVRINSTTAAASDDAVLPTALGQTIKVNVNDDGIFLRDKATTLINPRVQIVNINKGNLQIAHGIGRVLIPAL